MSAEGNDNTPASVSPDASASDHEAPVKRRTWLGTLVPVALGIVLCGCCAGLLLPAWSHSTEAGRRVTCQNQLFQIGHALHHYHSNHDCFPPAYFADESGRPIHSWRAMLLRYLVEPKLAKSYRFDEPWDGPHNRLLHGHIASCFHCPNENPSGNQTSYVAIVGHGTMWPREQARSTREVSDGSSHTILLVEVRDSGINWLEPRDLTAAELKARVLAKKSRESPRNHHSGGHLLMADLTVHWISDDDLLKYLDALISIDGHDSIGNAIDN